MLDTKIKYNLIKVLRFICIYGVRRTLSKVLGRVRLPLKVWPLHKNKVKDILLVGCGQFGFSTIGYFVNKQLGKRFLASYDPDENHNMSFSKQYDTKIIADSFNKLIECTGAKYIYIASNHFSHTTYAIKAILKGYDVYVEKPVSVNYEQFESLVKAVRTHHPNIYAGYNRPFSKAIIDLKQYIASESSSEFSINYFISGHLIPENHWYRNKEEGTRICGNLGHWIDLTIHLLTLRKLPDRFNVQISYSDRLTTDDNLSVSFTTEVGDIVTMMLTSRTEPFEGINETINVQYGDVIAKIDDFRKMVVWRREELIKYRYWPKDVGHEKAIMQPFSKDKREWSEVENSTLLMLFVKKMAVEQVTEKEFFFPDEWEKINHRISDAYNETNPSKPQDRRNRIN